MASASEIPPTPADLQQRCVDPGVRAGKPYVVELARNRAAYKCADGKHEDTLKFIDGVREAGKPTTMRHINR